MRSGLQRLLLRVEVLTPQRFSVNFRVLVCYYVIIIYAAVFHVKRGKCLEYRLYLSGFCAKMTVK